MGQILTDYSRMYSLLPSFLGYRHTQDTGKVTLLAKHVEHPDGSRRN